MSKAVEKIRSELEEKLSSTLWASLQDELEQFEKLAPESPDYRSLKIYFEGVSKLPWKKKTIDQLDPEQFYKKIDRYHVGRDKLKQQIVEYIAVASLKHSLKGPVFCFFGPPGVGKTNLAYAIADALGRNIIEFNLSDLETEKALRGGKRGRKSPGFGRILEGLIKSEVLNPVILLKEIDQPGSRWATDPATTLLRLFDPEENSTFRDNYLGLPFDLSDILFMTTANSIYEIPFRLRDRLESFQLSAYTPEEKLRIVKKNLLSDEIEALGLKSEQIKITDTNLLFLINRYTREAGVHYLEHLLAQLCRGAAYRLHTTREKKISFDEPMMLEILGPPRHYPQLREQTLRPGVVTGLVWTSLGGDIVFVEVSMMPGKGKVSVTGQIGEVMKESCDIAVSYIRAEAKRFGLDIDFNKKDIHIHVPTGSIQKDGPSAGITILTALSSWLLQKTVDPSLALTGEITLRGAILRVGAIKEKVIAAHRAGIKTVIIPKSNEQDLTDITDEVLSCLTIKLVENVDQVLELVMANPGPNKKVVLSSSPSGRI